MDKIIYQVDAFTNKRFGGNPAGVVPDASGLTDWHMQKIATEMNLSETAFILPLKNDAADFCVRFFTPEQEVNLCGHATIGAFYALAKKGYIEGNKEKRIIYQKTKAGILPVEIYFERDQIKMVMMTQAKPEILFDVLDISELADIMGINEGEIGVNGFSVVPKAISTGLPDIILPVKDLCILRKIKPDMQRLSNYSNKQGVVGVHVFTMEAEEENATLACRNFAPAVGINEEAATGTSNGALGAYLISSGILAFSDGMMLTCEQGYYMGRPSQIIVMLEGSPEDFTVKVGGQAVITIEGVIISD